MSSLSAIARVFFFRDVSVDGYLSRRRRLGRCRRVEQPPLPGLKNRPRSIALAYVANRYSHYRFTLYAIEMLDDFRSMPSGSVMAKINR